MGYCWGRRKLKSNLGNNRSVGRIIKGIGGFYTVESQGALYTLKAAGKFRNDVKTPLPGDYVEFDPQEGDDGAFDAIRPRRNQLIRPRVANVDLVFALVSARDPAPDYLLLDKLCISAAMMDIQVVAVLNKCDLTDEAAKATFLDTYRAFTPLCASHLTGEGMGRLRALARGRVSCFAGQSGVGKSSITRAFLPEREEIKVSGLSQKTRRGRHTTRHAELLPMEEGGGYLVDTPGFSLMELPLMEPERLKDYYPEFLPYEGKCRFAGCLHHREPDCAVKAAVEAGSIPRARWERYGALLAEAQEKWRKRYE